jgi:cholesterol transport system auxiliary component
MHRARLAVAFVFALAVASLTSCAKIRYPNYYVLNVPVPPSPGSGTAPTWGSVGVRQFGAPGFLREGPIVYRESPNQLGFYEYERWAVDPRHAVTSAMVRTMRSRGAFRSVDLYNGTAACDYLLTGSIDHLEEVDDGTAVWVEVALSAQLNSLRTGDVIWQGSSTKKVKVDNRSVAGVVDEMSHEIGSSVEALVSSMVDHIATVSPTLSRTNGGQ